MLGEGFAFDIEVRKGAGAYICGEETAIFESIEGNRGEPRNKPPFPVVSGLFAKPTVVNNVETLVNVLDVVLATGPGFAETGTEASTGTKLFCLSGHIAVPGVYEVPFGATLRELLELAGGVAGGRPLQALLMGGAAGRFLRPDELDLPLTFEGVREAKTTLGSGVVMVLDDTVDLPRFLMRIAAFFRNESCGQCVPCRVGTVRQQEALARLLSGRTQRRRRARAGGDRGGRAVHARRVDLRARPDGLQRDRVGDRPARGVPGRSSVSGGLIAPRRMVELEVDGQPVKVFEGQTILDACRRIGIDTPTLCYGETLEPANVCRVCVVEVEGSRVLAPACSRKVEAGMKVQTDSERVRLSRKLVLELLASSVDMSTTPVAEAYLERYEAAPERFGPPAPPDPDRDRKRTGHHVEPDGQTAATVYAPVKIDNELYVRDYSKCILCYKCVDACGEQFQNTFAIARCRPRFRRAHLDRVRGRAARVGMRVLRQLHRGLPDGRADVPLRARAARGG